ncbi:MAG: sensor histidine kinase [Bacilli bacterium]
MLKIISFWIGNIIAVSTVVYLFTTISDSKIKIGKIKLFFLCLAQTFIGTLITYNFISMSRLLLQFIITNLFLKYIYKLSPAKTSVSVFFIYFIYTLSEFIYINILSIISNQSLSIYLLENNLGIILTNIIISMIGIFLINQKRIKHSIKNIINWYEEKNNLNTILILLLSVLTMTIVLQKNFETLFAGSNLVFTSIFLIGILTFIIGFYNQKAEREKIYSKYDSLLKYSKYYEKEITNKMKLQHEYKNQLSIIKGMILDSDKKVVKYIDEILNRNNERLDHIYLEKLVNIPSGGLKGLLYYKLGYIIEKKIKTFIDISSEIKEKNLWYLYEDNQYDISRLIGIYIDNAIEAALKSKKKYIIFEAYVENNNLIFGISNSYSGIIDTTQMNNAGYTTKGKGRGYGLVLAKDILYLNKNILSQREVNGIYYIQRIIICEIDKKS